MQREINTQFWHFSQNNSGGHFVEDDSRGIGTDVIVEAANRDDAITRAESIGLYFDGDGDCPCCGNRWSTPWYDGTDEPTIYGKPVAENTVGPFRKNAFIHYFDGTVKKVEFKAA